MNRQAKQTKKNPAKASSPQRTGVEASAGARAVLPKQARASKPAKASNPERTGVEALAGERVELPCHHSKPPKGSNPIAPTGIEALAGERVELPSHHSKPLKGSNPIAPTGVEALAGERDELPSHHSKPLKGSNPIAPTGIEALAGERVELPCHHSKPPKGSNPIAPTGVEALAGERVELPSHHSKPPKGSNPIAPTGIEALAGEYDELPSHHSKPPKGSNPIAPTGVEASAGDRDELPKGWEWRRLGDICDIALGRTPSRDEKLYWGGSNVWATISDLNESELFDTKEHITDEGVIDSNSKPVPAGTLLMSFKLSIGKMAFAGRDLYTNEAIAALRVLNPDELDNHFLYYALKAITLDDDADDAAKGKTLNKAKLKVLEIPVPPLDEQHRIVARIEEFARRAKEALERLDELETEFDLLCRAMLFAEADGDAKPTPMSELVRLRPTDVTVRKDEVYHFAGVYSFGRGVFKGPVKSGAEFAYSRLTRIHTGEFIYPKLMAWEGGLGVVPPECDGFVVSPEFPVFEVNQDRVLPETLDVYFRSPSVWPMLSEISAGTNARRKRLHPKVFLAYEMPLPPMKTQQRLREMKIRVDELRKRHAQQRAELETLMPSVLDRAFRGEL